MKTQKFTIALFIFFFSVSAPLAKKKNHSKKLKKVSCTFSAEKLLQLWQKKKMPACKKFFLYESSGKLGQNKACTQSSDCKSGYLCAPMKNGKPVRKGKKRRACRHLLVPYAIIENPYPYVRLYGGDGIQLF